MDLDFGKLILLIYLFGGIFERGNAPILKLNK